MTFTLLDHDRLSLERSQQVSLRGRLGVTVSPGATVRLVGSGVHALAEVIKVTPASNSEGPTDVTAALIRYLTEEEVKEIKK